MRIVEKLTDKFEPIKFLTVVDDTEDKKRDPLATHADYVLVDEEKEAIENSHFSIAIVTDKFEGMEKEDRKKAVIECIKNELKANGGEVEEFEVEAMTVKEFEGEGNSEFEGAHPEN